MQASAASVTASVIFSFRALGTVIRGHELHSSTTRRICLRFHTHPALDLYTERWPTETLSCEPRPTCHRVRRLPAPPYPEMSRSTIPSKRPADAQEAAWVADEDRFVLQQAKKKAAIRVKGGRAQPIDWLAVTLAVIDPDRNPLDDEVDEADLDLVDPEGVFEGQDAEQLAELEKGIDTYLALETNRSNQEYWNMLKTICHDRRKTSSGKQPAARGVNSVASDLDKLLGPKNLEQLEKLEKQIRSKLSSNEPIDTDYWEHLLQSLLTYKARAKLRKVSQSVLDARLGGLRKQQAAEAAALKSRLEAAQSIEGIERQPDDESGNEANTLDPEPLLRLRPEDKALEAMSAKEFAERLTDDRRKVVRMGFVPGRKRASDLASSAHQEPASKRARTDGNDATLQSSSTFDRDVARGLGENEELFTQEEEVTTKNLSQWSQTHRPRKPKYFARVQLGYEWNKYNQTHYDHDNPPPKVVQGYKFNLFYPELVEKTKAPTYRIERENGRKRGQTFAPAGEDDTCVIRFVAGPPYEDIAFRIVDKEWDYSAKRERGFKSSFDKVRGLFPLCPFRARSGAVQIFSVARQAWHGDTCVTVAGPELTSRTGHSAASLPVQEGQSATQTRYTAFSLTKFS